MRRKLLTALMATAALGTAAGGQVVLNMPPAPSPVAQTTYGQDLARRDALAQEIDVGRMALARYGSARRSPDYVDAPGGPYGGWVAGYGYYPALGYYSGWGLWNGWWGGFGGFGGCGAPCFGAKAACR